MDGGGAMIGDEASGMVDHAAIRHVVSACAGALDARDWPLLGSLLADRVVVDLRAFRGDLHREVSREGLVKVLASAAAFDATRHLVSDHRVTIAGDRATCVAAVEARHWLTRGGVRHVGILDGTYTHALQRTAMGWKIARYALAITGRRGEERVFAWAGMAGPGL